MTEKKNGRPSKYCGELVTIICTRLGEGESLRSICADKEMPAKSMVMRWLSKEESFRDQYARAKELGAEAIFHDMLEIADDKSEDHTTNEEGSFVGGTAVQRARVQIDTRKWYLSKILPKKYGDKQQVEVSRALVDLDEDELSSTIKRLQQQLEQSTED